MNIGIKPDIHFFTCQHQHLLALYLEFFVALPLQDCIMIKLSLSLCHDNNKDTVMSKHNLRLDSHGNSR